MAEVKIGDSTSGQELSLFVRMEIVQKGGELGYAWYKLSETHKESNVLSPSFNLTQPDCHYLSAQVAVGPYIVVLGGSDFPHPVRLSHKLYEDVYAIDTRNPDAGWKKGPNLLTGRVGCYPFVFGNTICVIGDCYVHGEVLDLEKGIWKLFKQDIMSVPPFDIYAHGILDAEDEYTDSESEPELDSEQESDDGSVCYDYNAKKWKTYRKWLYVHGSKALYSYDFDFGVWKIIDQPVNSSAYRGASVDDVLYVLNPQLMGYSMRKKGWFNVAFDQLPNFMSLNDDTQPPSLVHLGEDILCILWTSCASSLLHCTKFTVKIEECPYTHQISSAAAQVTFSTTYNLPPGKILDFVAVSPLSAITFPFVE